MTAPANVRTCYRHPERAAGISCQRCDRPICPACMQQASVGFHCPECARAGAQREYRGIPALREQPVVTMSIIGVTVLSFLIQTATRGVTPFSVGGEVLEEAFGVGGTWADGALWGPAVPEEPWRIVTYGLLHSSGIPFGFLHVALNMWGLWIFGRLLEPMLGRAGLVATYWTALVGGAVGAVLLSATAATAGASGAVYGLLGALVVAALLRGVDLVRSGLATTLGIWVLFSFAPGISLGGHLGGLAAGAASAFLMVQLPPRLGARGTTIAAAIVAAIGVVLAGVAYGLMQSRFGLP